MTETDTVNDRILQGGAILSDIEILARLVADPEVEKRIFVSPLIDPETQIGPSSLDLRLGFDLVGTRATQATHIDLAGREARAVLREQKRHYFDKQRLQPGGKPDQPDRNEAFNPSTRGIGG